MAVLREAGFFGMEPVATAGGEVRPIDVTAALLFPAWKLGPGEGDLTVMQILVEGDSSRLHQMLVEEEQLAISVSGFLYEGFDPGLAYFYLTLPPDGDLALTEQRLFEELQRVATEGVTDSELAKARNITLVSFWEEMATISGKAGALGNAAVFKGSYERVFDVPQEIEAVTAEDLRAVAERYLYRNNATIGILRAPAQPGEVEE